MENFYKINNAIEDMVDKCNVDLKHCGTVQDQIRITGVKIGIIKVQNLLLKQQNKDMDIKLENLRSK